MPEALTPHSIFDLMPLEYGGIEARAGFAFQDHVALGFCLDLLVVDGLAEVWCETLDDITLIWKLSDEVHVEFVQVKASEFDQLWTVAKLCEKDKAGKVSSRCILEKSLGHDRCVERCIFRLVTVRPVAAPLKILTLPRGAPGRSAAPNLFIEIHEQMTAKVGTFLSPNGHDYTFWTERTFWDVRHAEEVVRADNLLKLIWILNALGAPLASDQLEELYTRLLKKVWDASRCDPRVSLEAKKIKQTMLEAWIRAWAAEIGNPTQGAPAKLLEKMLAATLPADTIDVALEQLRHFRHEQLQPKYLRSDDQNYVQAEVTAVLHSLKSRLDNSEISDDGVAFHALCLAELEKLRDQLILAPRPPLSFLQGAMYSVTGRCLHRFRRVIA